MSDKDLQVLITGDATGLLKALGESSLAMKSMATEMEATAAGLNSLFTNLAAPLAAIAGLVGGVEFLKGTVDATKDWTVEAQKLARVLGITTEQASVLNVAIRDIHGNTDDYLAAAGKMIKTLGTNEEAFTRLGVATRDNNGRLREAPSIMADVSEKLNGIEKGTDRGVAASQIFGKSWKEMLLYLKMTPDVIAEAQEKAERLNLIVGQNSVDATEAYRKSMVNLEDTVSALKIRLGNELMPVMTQWNEMLSSEGPAAIQMMAGFIKGLNLFTVDLAETFLNLEDRWNATMRTIASGAQLAGAAMTAIANRDLKGLKNAWQQFQFDTEVTAESLRAKLEFNELWMEAQRSKFDGSGNGNMGPQQPGQKGGAAPAKQDDEKEHERLKAALEMKKLAYEQESALMGEFHKFSKAQEADYWAEVLAAGGLGVATKLKVQQDYAKAATAELEHNHAETKAVNELYLAQDLTAAKAALDRELAMVEEMHRNGQISDQQSLDWKISIENRKFQAEKDSLEKSLLVEGLKLTEIVKIRGQIETVEQQHQAKMQSLEFSQADLDQQKNGWAGWAKGVADSLKAAQNNFEIFKQAATQVLSGVTNAFATGIQGMLSGQMNLRQGMKAIWGGIVQTITQAVAQMAAQWLVAAIAQKAFGMASVTTTQSAAAAQTAASLTAGAAGAWEAYGWIPYIGWGLAMAQIAAMEASVAAVGISSAAVGDSSAFSAGVYLAEGGRIDKPTLALMGEAGPELVAPESTFLNWAGNLEANIMARQALITGYGRQAQGFASSAPVGGQALPPIQITGPILDTTSRGLRLLGDHVLNAIAESAQSRGIVLKPAMGYGSRS